MRGLEANDSDQTQAQDCEMETIELDASRKIATRRLFHCLTTLREHSADLTLQASLVLLAVALNPGIRVSDLMRATQLSQSSCSRNIALLSDTHRLGKPGLSLVKAVEDPIERRRKIVTLTDRGKELVAMVIDAVR